MSIALPCRPPAEPERLRDLEWLACNGLGGFSSGSVLGIPTRRHHGMLVANLAHPQGRYVMLSRLDEHVLAGELSIRLSGAQFEDGKLDCDAHRALMEFSLDSMMPTWIFEFEGRRLQKTVLMPHRQNTVCVEYRLLQGPPFAMELRPFCAFRRQDAELRRSGDAGYRLTAEQGFHELGKDSAALMLRFALPSHPESFSAEFTESRGVHYHADHERGYEATEDHFSPGHFRFELRCGRPATFFATTDSARGGEMDIDALRAAQARRVERLPAIGGEADEFAAQLAAAADQFIILPGSRAEESALAVAAGEDARTVIAGYHWFGDWGRDTMISLEGLTLCTARYREANAILRTFSHYIKDGLLPNLFPEGEREALYHTVDATLWYFHAIGRYVDWTGDDAIVHDLYELLERIVEHHVQGTHYGIGVDADDGLLRAGAPGYQLTWMDAKVDDWVVTPRRGKPVEIQALWYNALCLMAQWSEPRGSPAARYQALAARARRAFNARYWNEAQRCLFDVIDGENGDDPSFRPNQVFALSLKYPILEQARWKTVLDGVAEQLLTPFGLRTLSPHDRNYQRTYHGNLRTRDGAYHQGTAWPWLIGHFVDAWLRVHDDPPAARAFLTAFPRHLREAGIGSISEIFDAEEPYLPRGCIAQAWSVAEVLRAWLKTAHREPARQAAATELVHQGQS